MFLEDENSPSVSAEKRLPGINKYTPLITLLVCTTISLIFMKTGILSLFYLVPLGYVIIVTGVYMPVFITAAAANIVIMVIQSFTKIDGIKSLPIEALYLTVVLLGFTWIIGGKGLRTAYRFVIASSICAIIFLLYINSPSSNFFELFSKTAEELFGTGDSEVQIKNPLFAQTFTPQVLTEFAKMFLLRGGALISMFFLFFVNRQIAVSVTSMIKRQRIDHGLTAFYAPVNTIWAFSASLATIVLTGIFKVEILSILAWNVFTICAIIYLAQGIGILMYWMSLRSNVFRLVINVLIIVVLFSPLNSFALVALVLLGIIDNWRPFRIAKSSFR
ncbi:YybS family protein [Treponema sp. R6D11]